MVFAKYYNKEEVKENKYLVTNLVFAFFPISLILGSLIVNINFLLFCGLGIFHLRSKILKDQYSVIIKIIFFFFLSIFFSSALSFVQSLITNQYTEYELSKLLKSIIFFRYFLFLVLVYLLNKFDILNFKYFFLLATLSSLLLSVDIIVQYFVGKNLLGFESMGIRNPGFFGDEAVAGGYLLRFSFFAIFFSLLIFEDTKYLKKSLTSVIISILGTGMLLSGNRMPLVLFIFGLFILFLLSPRVRTTILLSFVILGATFQLTISSNDEMKGSYSSYIESVKSMIFITPPSIQSWNQKKYYKNDNESVKTKHFFYNVRYQSGHRRLFLTAVDTWKFNKIFGNGIKSFRVDCHKLGDQNINLEEDIYPGLKNRLCSNHPHNYYFQILTETGIVGLLAILLIMLAFIRFVFNNIKYLKFFNIWNLFLFASVFSLFIEVFPIRSTGGLFTTNNTTYIVMIGSIVLCYKKLLKIK